MSGLSPPPRRHSSVQRLHDHDHDDDDDDGRMDPPSLQRVHGNKFLQKPTACARPERHGNTTSTHREHMLRARGQLFRTCSSVWSRAGPKRACNPSAHSPPPCCRPASHPVTPFKIKHFSRPHVLLSRVGGLHPGAILQYAL